MKAAARKTRYLPSPGHGLARMKQPEKKRRVIMHPEHPAAAAGHTMFPTRVMAPGDDGPVLKSGFHNRKIGREVRKGRWRGFPIYTLTLEERATCPSGCAHWLDCYGNKMHAARRFRHGEPLEELLEQELAALQRQHGDGFVVRLHVLGDFYSPEYAMAWLVWLGMFPALRVFGFTAWQPGTEIGDAVGVVSRFYPDRFWIRYSDGPGGRTTVTLRGNVPADAVVCPYETRQTDTCGTCGLCWTTAKRIAFMEQ